MTIRIDDVTLYHVDREKRPILQDVSCAMEDGTITLLVGQTGAGKSSLLDVLTGLRQADEGAVWYDEQPLWMGKKLHPEVQARIGVVFQYPEHQLFARTVEKEFAYSLRALKLGKEEVKARTRGALEQMGLPEEMMAQSPLTLSGGQKRRVALGTTFATQPKWLFLDEPTAGLDPQSVQRLVAFLQEWKGQTQGGIVMATHDLDAMFPIADKVIVVDQGRVVAHLSPQELCEQPEILVKARIGLPSSTQIALELSEAGVKVPSGPVSPEEMARAIVEGLSAGKVAKDADFAIDREKARATRSESVDTFGDRTEATHVSSKNAHFGTDQFASEQAVSSAKVIERSIEDVDSNDNVIVPPIEEIDSNASVIVSSNELLFTTGAEQSEKPISLVHALDPRAKWAFYMLFSIGILLQDRWYGLCFAAIITIVAILLSKVTGRELMRVIKPFLYFILFSVLLSGVRFGEANVATQLHIGSVGFNVDPALYTLKQLIKILLVMALGVLLSATTSQLRMKRGLEQSLTALKRFKLPVEAFSLAASLMLRFIPVIMRELERFSRITRARGKSSAKLGALRLRDVNVIVIPLLLSVLQLGEDLSLAMEARGYARFGIKRTASIQLRMNRVDQIALISGVGLFIFLWFLSFR